MLILGSYLGVVHDPDSGFQFVPKNGADIRASALPFPGLLETNAKGCGQSGPSKACDLNYSQ